MYIAEERDEMFDMVKHGCVRCAKEFLPDDFAFII
jgi:hypothetical protein